MNSIINTTTSNNNNEYLVALACLLPLDGATSQNNLTHCWLYPNIKSPAGFAGWLQTPVAPVQHLIGFTWNTRGKFSFFLRGGRHGLQQV